MFLFSTLGDPRLQHLIYWGNNEMDFHIPDMTAFINNPIVKEEHDINYSNVGNFQRKLHV